MLKKITIAVAMTGLMAGAAFAGTAPQTGINGSKHDMNKYTGITETSARTCVFCHTPHNAKNSASTAPLWNRTDSTFAAGSYSWKAPQNSTQTAINASDALQGPTRLCLSCHDGSIALDSHMSGTTKLTGVAKIADLSITHPVGFDYVVAQGKRDDIVAANTTNSFLGAQPYGSAAASFDTKAVVRTGTKTIVSVLSGGTVMTCASCHEVHNTSNAVNVVNASANYFLNAPEDGSAICLSCHIK
jgi:hypothetical protein